MTSLEDRVKWAERGDKKQSPLEFFRKHYIAGLTRGQLRKQDSSLYQRLRRDGLLENVPVSRTDFGNDPVAYYQEHHAGLTRGQLQNQDPSLYQRLRRDGLLENVPTKFSKSK